MIEQIANDVSNKLFTTTTNGCGDFVGIDAHIKAINSKLGLDSKVASMVGIVGPSGIGKTTIARALFSQLSSQFHHHAFVSYKRTIPNDYNMKLAWEEQFLSKILCQEDIKLEKIGAVEQRLKNKKVLIVLDDVDDLELLKTLVGHIGWFGPGSRIIVITQDRELLKSHKINLIHEPLQRLKKINLNGSRDLKKILNLSKAKNLKVLNLLDCTNLMVRPTEVNFESLEHLKLTECSRLKSFPLNRTEIASMWIKNIHRVTHLTWSRCPLRYIPSNFHTEHLVDLNMPYSKFEKLWKGVQPLENLESMDMRFCKNLKEIPDLSKATKLKKFNMYDCTSLEVLPTDVNLESLEELNFGFCPRLRTFPQISTTIKRLVLYFTAIEEVPSWIENMSNLEELDMGSCKRLKNISPSIFKLRHLKEAKFGRCSELTSFSEASVVAKVACIIEFQDFHSDNLKFFDFNKCFNLDQKAHEFILRLSLPMITVLPGGEVPMYFTHRTCGSSLIINLPQSSPSHELMRCKACIIVESDSFLSKKITVRWRFRGLNGVKLFDLKNKVFEDHPVIFSFGLADFSLNSHLSAFRSTAIEHKSRQCELDYNDMEFEFLPIGKKGKFDIKGCGIRLLDASPSQETDADDSDDGSSSYFSVSSSYPCLEEEALYVDPMITE